VFTPRPHTKEWRFSTTAVIGTTVFTLQIRGIEVWRGFLGPFAQKNSMATSGYWSMADLGSLAWVPAALAGQKAGSAPQGRPPGPSPA